MENNLAQQENIQKQSRFYNVAVFYADSVVRGLLAFSIVGIGFTLLLVGVFHMKFIWILPISFLGSILISPFLSKITLGEKVVNWYVNWLDKIMKNGNKTPLQNL